MILYVCSCFIRDADLSLNRNPFVETALAYTLSYISVLVPSTIAPSSITILADNDYYSASADEVIPGERFHNFDVPLAKANKTGLGSSAALVTAITAALLSHYLDKDIFDITSDIARRRLHNLAQASHCAAQGKVGSGFDVASAVYGGCLYRRFTPSILTGHVEPGKRGFAQQLKDLVEETGRVGPWDTVIMKDSVKVPKGLRLVMCDVSCGSQTPGMVKKVLAWRAEQGLVAEQVWEDLHASNQALVEGLKALAESGDSDYTHLRSCIYNVRKIIRHMSQMSGVPIEPDAQTRLLDACSELPGVVGGVVPGAGGYDAVALLVEDRKEVIDGLAQLLRDYRVEGPTEAAGSIAKVSLLGVREDMVGTRTESTNIYGTWIS